MIRKLAARFGLFLSLAFISGCWDSAEVNDIAIELAWGIDNAENDKIRISAQTIVPSKFSGGQNVGSGGGKGKPYFVVFSEGLNTLDAVQRMQTKLSRRMFRGHRRVIVIGETMARKGIKDILDTYSRDPNLKLRTDVFVVKNSTARHLLNVSYPLETIPGLGVLGENDQMGTPKEMGLLNLLLAASSEGASPYLPAIAIGMDSDAEDGSKEEQSSDNRSASDKEGFRIAGSGILNKELKLVGFLNAEEDRYMRWVNGNLRKLTVSETVPDEEGDISMILQKTHSHIRTARQGGKLKIHVTLTGQGIIRENNTHLDLTRTHNIDFLRKSLNRHVEGTVLQTISKVQNEYGTDVFGFSYAIRRQDLSLWRAVQDDWEEEFRKAEVTVKAKVTVRRIGITGPSLQLNPKEIKK